MGNQLASSCNPASGSCSLPAALQPSAVAKVLSLDGQVLHFTKSVKAIHVLLRHPNHCLCPAQSLRLSSHLHLISDSAPPSSPLSLPCSLLPDDELQLGCIYILLPFHTFRLFLSAAAAHSHHRGGLHRLPRSSSPFSRSSGHCLQQARTIAEHPTSTNGDRPTSNGERPSSIGDEPISNQRKPTSDQPPLLEIQDKTMICTSSNQGNQAQNVPPSISHDNLIRLNIDSNATPNTNGRTLSVPHSRRVHFSSLPASSAARRSFELQRPHRRGQQPHIRRCRSWRPRLQAITEMNSW